MTSKRKTIAIIALLIIAAGAAGVFYAYHEYNRMNNTLNDAKPVFTIDAVALIDEFTKGEKEANIKYLDKVILVNGIIKSIDKDDKGYYTVALGDSATMSSVRCSIDSTETSLAASLQTATPCKIKGICTGFNADEMGLGSDVILNRCILIKN